MGGAGAEAPRISIHHFEEVGWIPFSLVFSSEIRVKPWFAIRAILLTSLTGDLSSSTWQGTCPLFVYTMDLWVGNLRGNIGCDVRMLVGHKFTYYFDFTCVYCTCVISAYPDPQGLQSIYIYIPFLFLAWSCR